MKLENRGPFGEIRARIARYKLHKKDKKILIESAILTITYLLSFGILSLGRVPQSYPFISEVTFSNLQIMVLVFIFAFIITRVLYFIYREKVG